MIVCLISILFNFFLYLLYHSWCFLSTLITKLVHWLQTHQSFLPLLFDFSSLEWASILNLCFLVFAIILCSSLVIIFSFLTSFSLFIISSFETWAIHLTVCNLCLYLLTTILFLFFFFFIPHLFICLICNHF